MLSNLRRQHQANDFAVRFPQSADNSMRVDTHGRESRRKLPSLYSGVKFSCAVEQVFSLRSNPVNHLQ